MNIEELDRWYEEKKTKLMDRYDLSLSDKKKKFFKDDFDSLTTRLNQTYNEKSKKIHQNCRKGIAFKRKVNFFVRSTTTFLNRMVEHFGEYK